MSPSLVTSALPWRGSWCQALEGVGGMDWGLTCLLGPTPLYGLHTLWPLSVPAVWHTQAHGSIPGRACGHISGLNSCHPCSGLPGMGWADGGARCGTEGASADPPGTPMRLPESNPGFYRCGMHLGAGQTGTAEKSPATPPASPTEVSPSPKWAAGPGLGGAWCQVNPGQIPAPAALLGDGHKPGPSLGFLPRRGDAHWGRGED